jgi:hypothetical protein
MSLKVTDLLGLSAWAAIVGAIRLVIKDKRLKLFLKLFILETVSSLIMLAFAAWCRSWSDSSGILSECASGGCRARSAAASSL